MSRGQNELKGFLNVLATHFSNTIFQTTFFLNDQQTQDKLQFQWLTNAKKKKKSKWLIQAPGSIVIRKLTPPE